MRAFWICCFLVVALSVHCPAATDTGTLVKKHASSRALLEKKYILVKGAGVVNVQFLDALDIFRRKNLLDDVQAAYAAMLPEGEEPDFVIQHVASNRYSYVNRKDEKCDIEEVVRRVEGKKRVTLVYHTKGRRWFGPFESLTHVTASPDKQGRLAYSVKAYCYPHRGTARFFARVFRLIHIYFRNKTKEVTGIARNVATYIFEQEQKGE